MNIVSYFCVMEDPLLVQFLYILNPNRYSVIWYKNPRLSHHTNFDPEFSISHHLLLIPWNVPISSQLSHIKYSTNLIIVLLVSFNVQYFFMLHPYYWNMNILSHPQYLLLLHLCLLVYPSWVSLLVHVLIMDFPNICSFSYYPSPVSTDKGSL